MYPVIVCIAKKEEDYIEEFVKYHLALGFSYIYLYDNEDFPTYENVLQKYKDKMKFIHYPFNNFEKGVQFKILENFIDNYLFNSQITHVAHIDIDEFICLKKHDNIVDFIEEYIVNDCQGIGMNWRCFGSSGLLEKSMEPQTIRFTMCEKNGNRHIKTLFKKDNFLKFGGVHHIDLKNGFIKSTNGNIIRGPFNDIIDLSVIQLNHYKSKTFVEFKEIRSRFRADLNYPLINYNFQEEYNNFNLNEIEDLTAKEFYLKNCT